MMYSLSCSCSEYKKQILGNEIEAVGGTSLFQLTGSNLARVNALLSAHHQGPLSSCSVQSFYRAIVKGQLLYSAQYGRVTKRNSFPVLYQTPVGIQCGLIQQFLFVEVYVLAMIKEPDPIFNVTEHFSSQPMEFLSTTNRGILPVRVGDSKVIFVRDILCKYLFVDCIDVQYIAVFPCMTAFRHD